jgi:hypothetical protein
MPGFRWLGRKIFDPYSTAKSYYSDPTLIAGCALLADYYLVSARDAIPQKKVVIQFNEGKPISVLFPGVAEARVARTAPPVHAHQDSAWKEALLENGVRIRVPLFIAPGEIVRVDIKAGRYVERARAERKHAA